MPQWVPLLQYANERGVSLSTLRRRIKSNKIRYRFEEGRYLIYDESSQHEPALHPTVIPSARIERDIEQNVEQKLKEAHKEISELKTLVAFYEDQLQKGR